MASEWEELTLGDLGRVVTGKTPLTAVEGNFGGHIPFVTPSDMDGRKTIRITDRYLTEAGAASIKGSRIPAGAVMVSCIGSDMGKAVIAGRDCVSNQQINSIIVDDHFSSEFVYYNLSTRKSELRHQAAGGSAQPILNKGDFARLEITVPPLAEQRAIANILGVLDDKIELNRRMNETLEGLARAIFQSWFVDFDPVRAQRDGLPPPALSPTTAALFPDSFEDSELGKIPKGWTASNIGTFAINHDATREPVKENERKPGPYPYYGASGIVDHVHGYLFDGEYLLVAEDGENLRTRKTPVAFRAIGKFWVNNHAHVITGPTIGGTRFLMLSLERADIGGYLTGSTIPKLSQQSMNRIEFVLPSREVLNEFERVTDPVFAKIDGNRRESLKLAAIRDSLLPKLLSGEIRVAEAERLVEETT